MSNDQNRPQQDQDNGIQRQQPGQQNQQGERGQGQGGDTTRNPEIDRNKEQGSLGTGVDTGDVRPGDTNGANT